MTNDWDEVQREWVDEWKFLVRNHESGHEFGWPYGVFIRNHNLSWRNLTPWLEINMGLQGKLWTVGRFELLFLHEEDAVLFSLTWL